MEKDNKKTVALVAGGLFLFLGFSAFAKKDDSPSLPTGSTGYTSGGCNGGEAINWQEYGVYIGSDGSLDESYLGMNLPNQRGIRNNNAGNIKTNFCNSNYNYWVNELGKSFNTDGTFAQFTGFAWGLRAMIKLLRNYKTKYGINTIDTLIARYDVPTAYHYMDFVAQNTGFSRTQIIDLHDKETLRKLVKAMVALECSNYQVSNAQFETAYSLLNA